MRHYPLYASLLLFISAEAFAGAPMTLIPNTSTVQIRSDGAGVAAYTLTNTSQITLTDITIIPRASGQASASLSVQNNTCGSALNVNATCQFQILISGIDLGSSFSLSPEACAFNNTTCAVATSNYRPSVTVVPVTQPVTTYMALVSGPDENSIQPINASTQALGTVIPGFDFGNIISESSEKNTIGLGIAGLAVSPDGNALYVANPGNGNVSIVDVTKTPAQVSNVNIPVDFTAEDARAIPAHSVPTSLVVTPNNQSLYVLDNEGERAVVINVATQTVAATIPFAASTTMKAGCEKKAPSAKNSPFLGLGSAINPNGSTVYMTVSSVVAAINTSNNTATFIDCSYLDTPWGIAVAPDNSVLYVTNNGNSTLSVISTVNYMPVTVIDVGSSPAGVAVSPNGNTVYVANSDDNTISVINALTNTVSATIPLTGSAPYGLSVTPDGSELYVGYLDSDFTSVINTTTLNVQNVNLPGTSASFGTFAG